MSAPPPTQVSALYAVVQKARQIIGDKARNDALMQNIGNQLAAVQNTVQKLQEGNTLTASNHPALHELQRCVEAIDKAPPETALLLEHPEDLGSHNSGDPGSIWALEPLA